METSPLTLESDGGVTATVDLRVYGQDALLKTAHRFTDRCHVHLQTRDEHSVVVRFQGKDASCRVGLAAIVGEFFNELLDQRLRVLVQQESEPVRNLILAHALSRTSLFGDESVSAEPSDPESPRGDMFRADPTAAQAEA